MGLKETGAAKQIDITEEIPIEDYDDSPDKFKTWYGEDFYFEIDDDAEPIDLSLIFNGLHEQTSLEEIQLIAFEKHLPSVLALLTLQSRSTFIASNEDTQCTQLCKFEEYLEILYTFTIPEADFYFQLLAEEYEYRLKWLEEPHREALNDPFLFRINRGVASDRLVWQKKLPRRRHN